MNTVNLLYDATLKLHSALEKGMPSTVGERDDYISSVEKLLEIRKHLIERLPKDYTEEEKRIGRRVIKLNAEVDNLLQEQFEIMKNNLETFKQKQRRTKQYLNPYKNVAADGMFFDKKN